MIITYKDEQVRNDVPAWFGGEQFALTALTMYAVLCSFDVRQGYLRNGVFIEKSEPITGKFKYIISAVIPVGSWSTSKGAMFNQPYAQSLFTDKPVKNAATTLPDKED